MKKEIINIDNKNIFKPIITVSFIPNWFERLFNIKIKQKKFTHDNEIFIFNGGLFCWYDYETGKEYGSFPLLDNYLRISKWK
jgi:hypothetical protein